MTISRLQSIQAELLAQAEELLPRSAIGRLPWTAFVQAVDGSRYKLRRYPSSQKAHEIAHLLTALRPRVALVSPIVEVDDLLIFEYLELGERPEAANQAESLGHILAQIARGVPEKFEAQPLVDDFKRQIETLVRVGFLTQRAAARTKIWFDRLHPENPSIELAYWDAMMHNFGWVNGEFTLLDEKHLRPGYAGLSLVKPSLTLTEEEWSRVRSGYRALADLSEFEANLDFLTLNYLVGALHFYAFQWIDGRADVPTNIRMRRYRQALTRRIFSNRLAQLAETLFFQLRFPSATTVELRRRAQKYWRRRFNEKDEPSGGLESEKLNRYRHA